MRGFYLLNRRFGPLSARTEAEIRFTRREALLAALAAGAGLLSTACAARPRARDVPREGARHVVIVGGGFAGLACAHELRAVGYDVLVLEARNRVGGRVLTFEDFVPGRQVEGGGELIGSNHPTWIAYAERFGLTFRDVSSEDDLYMPLALGGKLLDEGSAARVWEEIDASLSLLTAQARDVDAERPWLGATAQELDAQSIASAWLDSLDVAQDTRAALGAELAGDNGVANERASWLGMLCAVKGGGLERYWTDSEVYRCAQGNQELARELAAPLEDRLWTGTAVRAIDAGRSPATVTCADGRQIECDDVVLAVPPSMWDGIDLQPRLPDELAPQMGVNTKYLTRIAGRFWRAHERSQYAVSDGPFTWTWESTDAQPVGEGAVGFTAFSGGPGAIRARAVAPAEREPSFHAELETLQPGFRASFQAARWMDWPADPWTRAGYSFPAPGDVLRCGPIWQRGLGALHFCGEHTSHAFVGYMEGALASGVACARRLAERDGLAS